jgi:hypothetical protein
MDIWKSVVKLNNAGVALILQNKDQAAIPLLSESLTLIKTIMNSDQQQQGPRSTAPMPPRFQHHDATHALSNLQDEHWFIWNEVFTISQQGGDNECLIFESDSQIVYTGMIIFNIALIYHRQSKLGKRSCLAEAERMYEMVATLLGCDSHNQVKALILLKLAALNNLSHIQHEQNNIDASRRGFRQLVWTVNSPATHHPPTSQVNVNSMLLNCVFINCHDPQLAPAA